jgi:nucleotide-binding universal stress UspA family protein
LPSGAFAAASVLHPTDRSEASLSAFYHAVALAANSGVNLTLLQTHGERRTDSFPGFPTVRGTIKKWRAHGKELPMEALFRQWRIFKVDVDARDPYVASMEHVLQHQTRLIVSATEGRPGSVRLMQASRAVRLARVSQRVALFVPHGSRPFVSGATGEIWLKRILVPVDPEIDPRPAVSQALRSAALLEAPDLEITLLHVEHDDTDLLNDLPDLPFCTWNRVYGTGDAAALTLRVARETRADAIYLPTSFAWPTPGSAFHGVIESVLQGAPCPVATVPAARREVQPTRVRRWALPAGKVVA